MRILVISLTAIVVAVQMATSAFLSSIFEIRHVLRQRELKIEVKRLTQFSLTALSLFRRAILSGVVVVS
jgi:uncharacterized membrane protein YciS (DUF1049 family)